MAEKEPMLPSVQPSDQPSSNNWFLERCKGAGESLNELHVKAVRFIHARDFLAEFLATLLLVTFGNAAIAQYILSHHNNGTFLTVNIGYGIGLMMGAYVAGGVTGAHMNPAVTLAMALRGKTAWIKLISIYMINVWLSLLADNATDKSVAALVIPYWIAQFLGAFLSSAIVYGVYVDAILSFDGLNADGTENANCFVNGTLNPKLPLCTGGIFATYPAPHLSLANGFLDQTFGTFFLVLGIFAICDSQNNEVKAGLKPLMIGFLLWGIGGSFGFNAGYAVNPARDLSPRLFTAIAGWGSDVFRCSQCGFSHWWWVPIVAPLLGAVIATPLYWLLIEVNHPQTEESESADSEEDAEY